MRRACHPQTQLIRSTLLSFRSSLDNVLLLYYAMYLSTGAVAYDRKGVAAVLTSNCCSSAYLAVTPPWRASLRLPASPPAISFHQTDGSGMAVVVQTVTVTHMFRFLYMID